MKISWPTAQLEKRHALLDAVRLTKDDIETHFKESEEQGHLAQATADALLTAGLLGLKLPSELGGAEADPVTQMIVIAELAYIDTSAAWCTMVSATNVGSAGAFLPDASGRPRRARRRPDAGGAAGRGASPRADPG